MIMTCCLLIYSGLEYKIRQQLKEKNLQFIDQKKKPTQKPTTRWVFFTFTGIHILMYLLSKYRTPNLVSFPPL